MQTLLVPIDFTAASEDALLYANKLAVHLPAEIVLVQAGLWHLLVQTPEQRRVQFQRLEALAERLRYRQLTRQSGRRIRYHYHLAAEALPEALEMLVVAYRPDFVVTALALSDCAAPDAACRRLPEWVRCPVLVVPPGRHELAARVVMAGDFADLQGHTLDGLPALARSRDARFDLVQFYPPTTAGLAPLKKALLAACAQIPTAHPHLLPEADALEGLGDFCAQQDAQLLVLATTDGCVTRRFFHPHYTQTHAYHLRIPVLLLPTSVQLTEARCEACSLRKAAAAAAQPLPALLS